MGIYKLSQGQSLMLTVTSVERDVPSTNPRYGPSHKFAGRTATDPDACIFMSPASAVRQLARIGLTLDTVVGQTVEFAKPGEYVDITLPTNGAQAVPIPASIPPAPVPTGKQPFTSGPHINGLDAPVVDPDTRLKAMFALYDRCFDHAAVTSKRLKAVDIPTTHEGIAAQTATLFIQANQRGLA